MPVGASQDFYQVVPIDEILYAVPVFPADLEEMDDPEAMLLCEHGWDM